MELIKTKNGYYVPRCYLYYDSGKRKSSEYEEHHCAEAPSYNYDKDTKKWRLEFTSADIGGYDIQSFTFYFDSEEDLISFLKDG